jgi:glc operon protein GlcG
MTNHVNGAGPFAWHGSASSKDMAMRFKFSLSFEGARTVVGACLEAARQQEVAVSIAVVDDAGALLCFSRMDGARAYTVELASQKARTSASVGVATGVIEAMSRAGAGRSREPNVGHGGIPVQYRGQCAGAVGVSGAKPEIDEMIAQAGIAVLTA